MWTKLIETKSVFISSVLIIIREIEVMQLFHCCLNTYMYG